GAGHGHGAAHQPGAEDGRALLDGEHRRISGGDGGGEQFRAFLHWAGDRGRQDSAGQGAGGGRRRGRVGGDRGGGVARRDRLRVRRAAGSGRADPVDGRRVRVPGV